MKYIRQSMAVELFQSNKEILQKQHEAALDFQNTEELRENLSQKIKILSVMTNLILTQGIPGHSTWVVEFADSDKSLKEFAVNQIGVYIVRVEATMHQIETLEAYGNTTKALTLEIKYLIESAKRAKQYVSTFLTEKKS